MSIRNSNPDRTDPAPGTLPTATTIHPIALLLMFVMAFSLALLGTLAWQHRGTINTLFVDAFEQKFLFMSEQTGPATFLVFHDDYRIIESFAAAEPDVLGHEVYQLPDIATLVFSNHTSPAIMRLTATPGIRRVQRKSLPLLCG